MLNDHKEPPLSQRDKESMHLTQQAMDNVSAASEFLRDFVKGGKYYWTNYWGHYGYSYFKSGKAFQWSHGLDMAKKIIKFAESSPKGLLDEAILDMFSRARCTKESYDTNMPLDYHEITKFSNMTHIYQVLKKLNLVEKYIGNFNDFVELSPDFSEQLEIIGYAEMIISGQQPEWLSVVPNLWLNDTDSVKEYLEKNVIYPDKTNLVLYAVAITNNKKSYPLYRVKPDRYEDHMMLREDTGGFHGYKDGKRVFLVTSDPITNKYSFTDLEIFQ